MKQIALILALIILIMPVVTLAANEVDVYIFTREGCPHCIKLEEWLGEKKQEYNLNIVQKDILANETNMQLFQLMSYTYGNQIEGVPATFVGDKEIIGFNTASASNEPSLAEQIEVQIKNCSNNTCESPIKKVEKLSQEQIRQILGINGTEQKQKLTIAHITALAAADAVNPCAFAVLLLVLVTIMTANPEKKSKILLGGLAFCASVFIIYMLYGIIIIQLFKSFNNLIAPIKIYLLSGLAVIAIILGILNIRDFFRYRPGGMFTEMPLFMRPGMKKLVGKIADPKGAFIMGAFVTLFLLPCTIGPYVIASGLLSFMDIMQTLPWLAYYNLVFIAPMVGITLIVYFGISTVQNLSGWKEHNIKWFHLAAGILLVLVGLAVLMGWI